MNRTVNMRQWKGRREEKKEGVVNIWGICSIGGVVGFGGFEGKALNKPVNRAVRRAVNRFNLWKPFRVEGTVEGKVECLRSNLVSQQRETAQRIGESKSVNRGRVRRSKGEKYEDGRKREHGEENRRTDFRDRIVIRLTFPTSDGIV